MKYENGKITFASGNVLDMHGAIAFSLSICDGDWHPTPGDHGMGSELNAADRAKIADHMIARWQQWKEECAK